MSRLATLLAPLPAVLLLGAGLWRAPTATDAREDQNAGLVLGGVLHADGVAAALDAVLAQRPRVLVIGNSNANSDVDPVTLARGLAVRRDDVAVLSIPNASAVHFVAILRRLQGRGWRPDLVLVVSRLQLVLVDTPISEGARRSLEALLGPDDGDLRPVGGRWIRELVARREALRDRLGAGLRSWLPRAFGTLRPEAVLRRALSDERIDPDRLGRPAARALPSPERSRAGELARTARALGVDLVVARPPPSPLAGPEDGDVVPAGFPERTRAVLEAEGARWADLSALRMQPHHYRNADHLDDEGARRLTGALLALLRPPRGQRLDALGAVRFVDGVLRRDTGTVTWAGPPPALPEVTNVRFTGDLGVLEVDLAAPDDAWTQQATRLSVRCSPVRAVMDGALLPGAGLPCTALRPGSSCHRASGVHVRAPDTREHRWSVALDPERSCDGARWLYPGDRAELRWTAELPGARLEIEVVARGAVRVDAALAGGSGGVAVPGRTLVLPTSAGPQVLSLHSDGYALVTRAELVLP